MVSKNVGKPTFFNRRFPTFYNRHLQGTSHKGMKGDLMWVFPFSMTNVFSGTYKPSYIYKLTTK
jgi:hypothetical protein